MARKIDAAEQAKVLRAREDATAMFGKNPNNPNELVAGIAELVEIKGNRVYICYICSENPPFSDTGKSFLLAHGNIVFDSAHRYNGLLVRHSGNIFADIPEAQRVKKPK